MAIEICAVSGSRADYGLLYWPLRLLQEDSHFELSVVATGSHLSALHGETWRQIESDGFSLAATVDMQIEDDSALAVTRSLGRAVLGFADVLATLRPQLLLVLGDRYEILAAVQAALIARIPVVHLCGGDITEGAIDDAIRHAITKLSHLHFVTNEDAARRVAQLGEDPANIHVAGSPGLDGLSCFEPMTREAFFSRIGLRPGARNAVVTYHPETLAVEAQDEALAELLAALDDLGPDFGLIFTGTNADVAGRTLQTMIERFVAGRRNACFHASLGQTLYFNALTHADVVIGNSSSGLYEAPSFKRATVNVGDRQAGRPQALSVVNTPARRESIVSAIHEALSLDCSAVVNPYGDGHSAPRIVGALKALSDPTSLLKKRFHEWPRP